MVISKCPACAGTGSAPCEVDRYPRGICPFAPVNWKMIQHGTISVPDRSLPHAHPCHRCGAEGSALMGSLCEASKVLDEVARQCESINSAERKVDGGDPVFWEALATKATNAFCSVNEMIVAIKDHKKGRTS